MSTPDAASLWALLTSFTNPDPQVQAATMASVSSLGQTWAEMPYALAELLAHGNPSAASAEEQTAGQQAAGTVLKQMLSARLDSVKAMTEAATAAASAGPAAAAAAAAAVPQQYPQLNLAAFDVPLLFAICSSDKRVQLAGSGRLSQLVQYANASAKLMALQNADGAAAVSGWITQLVTRLEQLVQSDNVANNHVGVSRCVGVLMEDRTQELLSESRAAAATGNDTEEHASAALVQGLTHMTQFVVPIYRLLAFLVANSNAFPAKLNALSCVAGITFILGEPGVTGDSDDEDEGGLAVKGVSPTRRPAPAGEDAKAARIRMANELYRAEKHLVNTVAAALPAIVQEALSSCDVASEEGVRNLLDALTTALKALTAVAGHWHLVQALAIAVLPTVLQWLAAFDWRQQAAKAPAVGQLVIDPAVLRNCSFETDALRVVCLDFVSELAQQIEDNDDVCGALTAHHVAILQQLYAASVLDQLAVSEVTVEADRHVPDDMKDILFSAKKKDTNDEGGNNGDDDDDELLDDGAENDTMFKCTSPSRTAAMFCFGAIALVLPPAFVFAVMDMLHPVVQRHLTTLETTGAAPQDWLELEGALSFLAEALTNGATTGDDDGGDDAKGRMSAVAEQVAVICCRFLGIAQSADGASFAPAASAHFAGPVRAASAVILSRIGERLVYDNSPEEATDASPAELAEYLAKTGRQNVILDTIMSVLYHTAVNDGNKGALRSATGAFAAILQHSFVAQADDEDDDDFGDDDEEEEGAAANGEGPSTLLAADGSVIPCVHVKESHTANYYGLSASLTSMPLSQRMVFYKTLPDICKADVSVMKRSATFLRVVEPVVGAIVAAWKQLVPSLDSYESLALGDLIYEVLQSLSKEEPYRQLPASCARALWADIGVSVFQTSGIAQNLMNGADPSGLTTETVSMATDVLSQVCDATDSAVTAELFQSTGIATVIAGIVLPILTRAAASSADGAASEAATKASTTTEELTRAALGLLGDFCGIVPPAQVHSVADVLVAPIAHVLVEEARRINDGSLTLSADGKSVTKTHKGGLKVTSIGGADMLDLFGDEGGDGRGERVMIGNALFCLAKLLESVSTSEELLSVCPTALPSPAALEALVGSCAVLLKLIGQGVTKLNLLIVTAKFGALFPAVLDGVGGATVVLAEAKTLALIDDVAEQLDVALSIGAYFGASAAVQQRCQEARARGLVLSLALAVAPALKKCMAALTKGDTSAVSASAIEKAKKAHAVWAPMVAMCQDAIGSAPSAKYSTTMKTAEKKLMQSVYF